MKYLYDELKRYCSGSAYPFHMPGHKRRLDCCLDKCDGSELENIARIDITEIDGFDNLHHAEGVLKEAQQRAARLCGSEETYFLVNGSTAGILSAIGACATGQDQSSGKTDTGRKKTKKIIMARNSHKAAYHAVWQNHLEVVYLYPEPGDGSGFNGIPCIDGTGNTSENGPVSSSKHSLHNSLINGPIRAEEVRKTLEQHPDVCAVFITSPTYDGVVSDVAEIARIAHERDIPLIVDEAHGAHFGMHPYFPESSVKLGADYVIHSLHKTLPSLTQTALLHVNGSLADRRRLRQMLDIYQTSSPSYILMASMDECVRILTDHGTELFETFTRRLADFRTEMKELKVLELLATDDPSKILIRDRSGSRNGLVLSEELRSRYGLELEMAAGDYALALSSVGDDAEGFQRLAAALKEMDWELQMQLNRQLEPQLNRQLELQLNQQLEPQLNRQLEPQLNRQLELQLNQQFELQSSSGNVSRQLQTDRTTQPQNAVTVQLVKPFMIRNKMVMPIAEAIEGDLQQVPLARSTGSISGEFIYLYPPGIPMVVPGERIEADLLAQLLDYRSQGYSLQGLEDYQMQTILVVKNATVGNEMKMQNGEDRENRKTEKTE